MFINQPQDSTACVGSQARMDCTYMGISSVPSWFINSTAHSSQKLPLRHKYNAYALIVDRLTFKDNNTTYQCFFPLNITLSNGSHCQVTSTIGKLIVLPNGIFALKIVNAFVELSIFLYSGACEQRPENITRTEGEPDVFIPCTVPGYIPPIWEINGSVYELFQLPEIFIPAYTGIFIDIVQRNLHGTSFRCYTSTGSGYMVQGSSTGYLTVTLRGKRCIITA